MARKTDNDDKSLYFQTGRFVHQNGEWFYITRGGEQRGPFMRKEDAEDDMISYIRNLNNMQE